MLEEGFEQWEVGTQCAKTRINKTNSRSIEVKNSWILKYSFSVTLSEEYLII